MKNNPVYRCLIFWLKSPAFVVLFITLLETSALSADFENKFDKQVDSQFDSQVDSQVDSQRIAKLTELAPNPHKELAIVDVEENYENVKIKTQVKDLDANITTSKPSSPETVVELEFSSHSYHEHHELKVSELEKQQVSPTSPQKSENFPLVQKLSQTPVIEKPEETQSADPNYKIPPRIAPNNRVNPFTTAMPLNGVPISHLTDWEIVAGDNFGNTQKGTLIFNGIAKVESQIKESLTRNNIFTVEQTGSYIQQQLVTQTREISVAKKEPQTLFGTQIQMSLTGSCILPGSPAGKQCTYTPGLVTDNNSIDTNFLVPTRINQTANVGEVLTPESIAYMKLPGYQGGANGQQVGINLYFPNAGALPGNTGGNTPFYTREEIITNTAASFYSTVRQVVRANDKKAVIGRTVRGYGFILNDDNTLLNAALQLGNVLFKDADPQIEGSEKPVNPNINKNLFLAANNTRLPANSFTIYHAGIGQAISTPPNIKNLSEVPPGNFNSIWLGLSPITLRNISPILRYEAIDDPRILASAGAEGGAGSNVSLFSVVNGSSYSPATLQDFYAQIYLANTLQDAYFARGSKLTEKTVYYPHISFSGNITGSRDVWRYYAGVIAGENTKAYLGGDVNLSSANGWNLSLGAIGYINPDRDYYSQLSGSLSKTISFSRNANFVLSTGVNYALDRDNRIGDVVSISPASSLTVGARANLGPVSVGLVKYFSDILPNSVANTLLVDWQIKFSDYFRISGYYTPINESSSRSKYGASAQLKLGNQYNSPTLNLSWNNNYYDYGRDADGNNFNVTDNVFRVIFKFGGPSNPFDQQTAERLRQRNNQSGENLQRERNPDNLENQTPNPVAP